MRIFNYVLIISILLIPCSIYAVNGNESSFDIKLGTSYPNVGSHSPDTPTLDFSVSFNLGLDKYFALGLESGLNWVQWDMKHPAPSDSSQDIFHALTVPILLNARVRFDLRETYYIMPYITAGAGYSLSFLINPGKDLMYGGFSWQAMAGTSIRPVKTSYIEILVETGYRGISMTSREDYRMNMSGFIARIAARFSLGIIDKIE